MSLSTDAVDTVGAIAAAEWDALVEAAGAPVFYRHAFLTAYERSPLQPPRLLYVIARDGDALVAAVPCQLHEDADPLGTLARIVPDGGGGGALITHVLHCYDTRVPATELTEEVGSLVCDTMRSLAIDVGAAWYGFANVASEEGLATLLRKETLAEAAMTERYRADVEDRTFDEFLSVMKSDHRIELGRQVRRASEAGVRVEIHDGSVAHVDALVGMLADLAGRHDASAYYWPERVVPFVRSLTGITQVIEIWLDDVLLAGGVCFVDRGTLHLWAAGARYGVTPFSPYYVLVYESIRLAWAHGASVIEGGRGNGVFKQRHGFRPVPLSGFVGRAVA